MGDRAVIVFQNGPEATKPEPFAVYLHWAGDDGAEDLAKEAMKALPDRLDDIGYFSARMIGLYCAEHPGSTGIGIIPALDAEFTDLPAWKKFSHGDAGVMVLCTQSMSICWIEGTGYANSK